MAPLGKRKLRSFIDGYKEYHAGKGTPVIYQEWAALWCVASAVERRVWVITKSEPLYPNLFIFIVGASGAGKSLSIKTCHRLVGSLGPNRLGASSMTSAYLASRIQHGERKYVNPITNQGETFYALNMISPELQVLIPAYDIDMLAKLTDLYDCGQYSEGRRDEDNTFFTERTCMNLIAATTEVHLLGTFPEQAFGTGFMSRVVLVYAPPTERQSLFTNNRPTKEMVALEEALKHDLKIISQQAGEFVFTPEAVRLLDEFYTYPGNMGGPPVPDHPNLVRYCERRHANLEKMMMNYALDEGDDLLLTEEHFYRAHALLIETEAAMPDIFKASVEGSDMDKANQLLYAMMKRYRASKLPIHEGQMQAWLSKRTTAYHAMQIVSMLIKSGKLRRIMPNDLPEELKKKTGAFYVPLAISFTDKNDDF